MFCDWWFCRRSNHVRLSLRVLAAAHEPIDTKNGELKLPARCVRGLRKQLNRYFVANIDCIVSFRYIKSEHNLFNVPPYMFRDFSIFG